MKECGGRSCPRGEWRGPRLDRAHHVHAEHYSSKFPLTPSENRLAKNRKPRRSQKNDDPLPVDAVTHHSLEVLTTRRIYHQEVCYSIFTPYGYGSLGTSQWSVLAVKMKRTFSLYVAANLGFFAIHMHFPSPYLVEVVIRYLSRGLL